MDLIAIVQKRVADLLSVDERLYKGVAIAALTAQFLAAFAAFFTNVMLYADGAWFVFALSAGEAWALKWKEIAARLTVYGLTVAPTAWLAQLFDWAPVTISRVNGFLFYAVPALQMAIAFALVWRKHAAYLLFPVAQYAFFSALSFGFPSEILLAPGFLWIALFLVLTERAFSVSFVLCFFGAVFAHELAIPAALVAGYLALRQTHETDKVRGQNWRSMLLLLAMGLVLALFVFVRAAGGGAGSDAMAIYVFDPRRVLNNPTLWLLIATLGAAALVLHRSSRLRMLSSKYKGWLLTLPLMTPILLKVLWPDLNFAAGRYDSARTLIGGGMFLLALGFALSLQRAKHTPETSPGLRAAPYFLAAALAFQVGAAAGFLWDWSLALSGVQRVASIQPTNPNERFISYQSARPLMTAAEADANDRIAIQWVLPFRSIVLAQGAMPAQVIYDDLGNYTGFCQALTVIKDDHTRIKPEAVHALTEFSCTHPAPPPVNTLTLKLKKFLAERFGKH
ncbi:MAG: hypothetical protein ABWZ40_11230 [Caulobacterales bacterium]